MAVIRAKVHLTSQRSRSHVSTPRIRHETATTGGAW